MNHMNGACRVRSKGEDVARLDLQLLITTGLLSFFLRVQFSSMVYYSFVFTFKESANTEHNGKCAVTQVACSPPSPSIYRQPECWGLCAGPRAFV